MSEAALEHRNDDEQEWRALGALLRYRHPELYRQFVATMEAELARVFPGDSELARGGAR